MAGYIIHSLKNKSTHEEIVRCLTELDEDRGMTLYFIDKYYVNYLLNP